MRRLPLLVVATLSLSVVVAAGASANASARAGSSVYMEWQIYRGTTLVLSRPVQRPAQIDYDAASTAGTFRIVNLGWRGWGTSSPVGTGTELANMQGGKPFRVFVRLRRIRSGCIGLEPAMFYDAMRVESDGSQSPWVHLQHGPCQ